MSREPNDKPTPGPTPAESAPEQPPKGEPPVNDQLDVTVQDTEVLAEIEMMTNLIIATSDSDGSLPQVKIDEILGIGEDESSR